MYVPLIVVIACLWMAFYEMHQRQLQSAQIGALQEQVTTLKEPIHEGHFVPDLPPKADELPEKVLRQSVRLDLMRTELSEIHERIADIGTELSRLPTGEYAAVSLNTEELQPLPNDYHASLYVSVVDVKPYLIGQKVTLTIVNASSISYRNPIIFYSYAGADKPVERKTTILNDITPGRSIAVELMIGEIPLGNLKSIGVRLAGGVFMWTR